MGLSPFVLANPTREVIICKNDHYQLMVRDTAVVTYKSATLSFSGRTIQLQCQMELIEKSDLVNYSCMEDRAGDGRYLAGLLMEKNTGTANISHEQIYPLKPKTLAEISCVLTEE
jgi:hypothetical protein